MKTVAVLVAVLFFSSLLVHASPSAVSILKLNYDRGSVKVVERFSSTGYYPDRRVQPDSNYSISVVSEDSRVLYYSRFSPPVKEYLDGSDGSTNFGGVLFRDAFNFSLIVPSFYNEREIVVSGREREVFEIKKGAEKKFIGWVVAGLLVVAALAVFERKRRGAKS